MDLLRRRRRWRSQQRPGAPSAQATSARKFALLRLAIVLLFALLALQLARLQLLNGEEYRQRAESNRLREVDILPPRGLIYDRQGVPLVRNDVAFAAVVTPADLPRPADEAYAELERILGVPKEEIARLVEEQRRLGDPFNEVVVKDNLEQEKALALKEASGHLPGVSLRTRPARRYEAGPLAAHVLGYVGPLDVQEFQRLKSQGYQFNDHLGKTGVEMVYEAFLRGKPGRKLVEIDAIGQELRTLREQPPKPGYSLVLTIDLDLQEKVAEELERVATPGSSASAVVMDVQTGDILAMVSLPSFDNNLFAGPVAPQEVQALLNDPGKPLVNHAVAEMYPPGSTFKLVTGLAALQEGIATPATTITSRGYITVRNQYDPSVVYVFRDWAVLGGLDFYQGIAMSSDVYFYYLAGGKEDEGFKGLGATRLAQYARAFGLGSPTGIDLPGETAGLVPDPVWKEEAIGEAWVTGDSYNFGIGQGYIAATPLHLLNVTAAIANGGWLLRPHVAKSIVDSDGTVIATIDGRTNRQVPVDPRNLAIMREAMRQSVDWGVAKTAQVRGMAIAGKTGTAEFGPPRADGSHETHGWFVGFAPFEDPQVAIVVFVQRGSGGNTAAPTAARILDYLFNQSQLARKVDRQ